MPVVYNYSLIETNDTFSCNFNDQYSTELISYMDLANRVILPSIPTLAFSILLINDDNKKNDNNDEDNYKVIRLENIS